MNSAKWWIPVCMVISTAAVSSTPAAGSGFQTLDLKPIVNMDWRDEVWGDGKSGWKVGRVIAGALGLKAAANGGDMVEYVACRIADADEIRRSRQFPYQFLAAYLNASQEAPQKIKAALHRAAEIACGNVPELPGPVVIGLDVSGSMAISATGWRGRVATSKMRCVDVAALFAAAVLRRNPDSIVIPFDVRVDPGDTILSLAERLARYGGGGTNCSLPLAVANSSYRNRRLAGCVL